MLLPRTSSPVVRLLLLSSSSVLVAHISCLSQIFHRLVADRLSSGYLSCLPHHSVLAAHLLSRHTCRTSPPDMTSSNKSHKEPALLGDDSKLSFASCGTWKKNFMCHLADKRCGIYEQLGAVMPRAYPPEPRGLTPKSCCGPRPARN